MSPAAQNGDRGRRDGQPARGFPIGLAGRAIVLSAEVAETWLVIGHFQRMFANIALAMMVSGVQLLGRTM